MDEVGDLPLPMQAKLLRALQEKEGRRIGAKETTEYDKSLYTDKALLQRDALRFDNEVRETLMKLYTLTDEVNR